MIGENVKNSQALTPRNRVVQIILIAIALLIAFTYSLKPYWLYSPIAGFCFIFSSVIGFAVILFCISYKRLYFSIDFISVIHY